VFPAVFPHTLSVSNDGLMVFCRIRFGLFSGSKYAVWNALLLIRIRLLGWCMLSGLCCPKFFRDNSFIFLYDYSHNMSQEEKFLRAFKQEHQVILDLLLELRRLVKEGKQCSGTVKKLDEVMGPHFQVEEEALYPMLKDYVGEEGVRKLLKEHEGAYEAMHLLAANAGDAIWVKNNGEKVVSIMHGMFMHVTSCDGLSIIIERFSSEQKRILAEALDRVHSNPQPLTVIR
jgi:hypothetical protein